MGFIVVAVASLYVAWHMSTPRQYQLDISNESSEQVDKVSLFGMGVYTAESVVMLPPGQVASLLVDLRIEGDLRFSVEQGGNKIDHLISRDVAQLSQLKQWLTISEGHRYLINHIE